jgi:hypothetical protein
MQEQEREEKTRAECQSMIEKFVDKMREDARTAEEKVEKAKKEMKQKNAQKQNPLDPELSQVISKIKKGTCWMPNGETKGMMRMTMADKFLIFGLMDKEPSSDMAQVQSIIKEIKKKNGWPIEETHENSTIK